jgi:lipopolysaccharide/colanic/teichoic acid biosynthesis glycosyltransferase
MEARSIPATLDATLPSAAVSRSRSAAGIRRAAEFGLALGMLVVLAPLLLLVALAIRLDSAGPALFRQRRVGRRGREFPVLKFRTMATNANSDRHREYVARLIDGQEESHDDGRGCIYKLAVDDRVTRVGRLLRRWSLDEVPQLINVVRGQMSLVGPRPVIAYEAEMFPSEWNQRFAVKPGMTGLWQVSGRNERTYSEMIDFDCEYARRQSLWLDLVILFKTVPAVVLRRGAA